jgi:hypothetical protein
MACAKRRASAADAAGDHDDGEFQQGIKENELVLLRARGSGNAGNIQLKSFRR